MAVYSTKFLLYHSETFKRFEKPLKEFCDGPTDRRTDGPTDRRTDRKVAYRVAQHATKKSRFPCYWMEIMDLVDKMILFGHLVENFDFRTDGPTDRPTDRRIDGPTDRRTNAQARLQRCEDASKKKKKKEKEKEEDEKEKGEEEKENEKSKGRR